MKLQYRDRWPLHQEIIALGANVRWMVRFWSDDGWTESEIVVIIRGEDTLRMCGHNWEELQHETGGGISVAPIDRDGNAVKWPKLQLDESGPRYPTEGASWTSQGA